MNREEAISLEDGSIVYKIFWVSDTEYEIQESETAKHDLNGSRGICKGCDMQHAGTYLLFATKTDIEYTHRYAADYYATKVAALKALSKLLGARMADKDRLIRMRKRDITRVTTEKRELAMKQALIKEKIKEAMFYE